MLDHAAAASDYDRLGYLSPVSVLTEAEVAHHRGALERAEEAYGKLHFENKMHTVLPSAYELATHPAVLDAVEALIGPDILLYDVTYIVKEPHSPSFVSWHQDLMFWGFDDDAQVSLWLALSPANAESGCMRMIPGSHKQGVFAHQTGDDGDNVLLQSQTVQHVDEADAVVCPLKPGEASFHHGWTLHASMPNNSDDRRIGLNAQYMNPRMKQLKHDQDTAMLVRGADRHGHFGVDVPAQGWFEPEAVARWRALNKRTKETQGGS